MRPAFLRLVLVLAALALAVPAPADEKEEEGFTPLFNGRDLTGWKAHLKDDGDAPGTTFTARDGILVVSGRPSGYLYTDQGYKDYVLRFDWRFVKPAEGKAGSYNSGLLVHIQGEPEVWPKCVEVQGADGDPGHVFGVGATFTGKTDTTDPKAKAQARKDMFDAQKKALKPVGEWNTTEVTCKADGSVSTKLNGVEIDSGKGELTGGPIGFQSEGAEVHLRNIQIKLLK